MEVVKIITVLCGRKIKKYDILDLLKIEKIVKGYLDFRNGAEKKTVR